jgi:SAM-dependent methyltransferase
VLDVLEEHRVYLSDGVRLAAFRRAIRAKIRPGMVVLDLGAGTGILGFLALEAGAARVYAVEARPVLRAARDAAHAAGFGDRWVGIRGVSTRIDLPEKADLVVSDHVGCFGVDYGILEAYADARARHLKRGGAFLPEALELRLRLVESPELRRRVSFWRSKPAGFRLPGLERMAAHTITFARPGRGETLSPPGTFARLDLREASEEPFEGRTLLRASRAGTVHGLLGFFRARLARGVHISNDPGDAGGVQRSPVLLPLERPLRVRRGERCTAVLRMQPSRDLATWRLDTDAGSGVEHSTFHGLPFDPRDLARARPDHRPRLNRQGEALAATLALCRRGWTVARIRSALRRRFPSQFSDVDHAGAFLVGVLGEVDQ